MSTGDDTDLLGLDLAAAVEAAELRDRALKLLAVGVGDHTPIEVQERVAEIARRLAELELLLPEVARRRNGRRGIRTLACPCGQRLVRDGRSGFHAEATICSGCLTNGTRLRP